MKRNFAIVGIVVMFVAGALALSSRPASADGALIIQHAACNVVDANCDPVSITDVGTTFSQQPSGNSKASCQGTLPPGAALPAHGAVHCNGSTSPLTCGTEFGTTSDWKETISPSGQVNLQCFVH